MPHYFSRPGSPGCPEVVRSGLLQVVMLASRRLETAFTGGIVI